MTNKTTQEQKIIEKIYSDRSGRIESSWRAVNCAQNQPNAITSERAREIYETNKLEGSTHPLVQHSLMAYITGEPLKIDERILKAKKETCSKKNWKSKRAELRQVLQSIKSEQVSPAEKEYLKTIIEYTKQIKGTHSKKTRKMIMGIEDTINSLLFTPKIKEADITPITEENYAPKTETLSSIFNSEEKPIKPTNKGDLYSPAIEKIRKYVKLPNISEFFKSGKNKTKTTFDAALNYINNNRTTTIRLSAVSAAMLSILAGTVSSDYNSKKPLTLIASNAEQSSQIEVIEDHTVVFEPHIVYSKERDRKYCRSFFMGNKRANRRKISQKTIKKEDFDELVERCFEPQARRIDPDLELTYPDDNFIDFQPLDITDRFKVKSLEIYSKGTRNTKNLITYFDPMETSRVMSPFGVPRRGWTIKGENGKSTCPKGQKKTIKNEGNKKQIICSRTHGGVDIIPEQADWSTLKKYRPTVHPVLPGRIKMLVKGSRLAGTYAVVEHEGGRTTEYMHLDRFSDSLEKLYRKNRKKGKTRVVFQKGEGPVVLPFIFENYTEKEIAVGIMGYTGNADYNGPHLHYQEKRDGHIINPERFLPIDKKGIGIAYTDHHELLLRRLAEQLDIDPDIASGIRAQESNNMNLRSAKGAVGFMQVVPRGLIMAREQCKIEKTRLLEQVINESKDSLNRDTERHLTLEDLNMLEFNEYCNKLSTKNAWTQVKQDPHFNMLTGLLVLKHKLEKFGGDYELALAGYSIDPSTVQPALRKRETTDKYLQTGLNSVNLKGYFEGVVRARFKTYTNNWKKLIYNPTKMHIQNVMTYTVARNDIDQNKPHVSLGDDEPYGYIANNTKRKE